MSQRALTGVRVLDLADRSAALAGRILADLGAEVIMVEPLAGNSIRLLAPQLDDVVPSEASCSHQYFSANKKSVIVDLRDDIATFLSLVETADVVIDTYAPGRLDELGVGHDVLRGCRSDLIQCSVTPFGLDAPWSSRTATDIVAGAAGGLIWLSGEPKGRPVQGGADVSYAMAGLTAASAISIALHQRDHSGDGVGVHIDLSLQEATVMAAMQTATPSQWTWRGRIPRRPGLSAALRCADGGYVGHLVRPDRFDSFLAWADRVGIEHGMTSDDWEWSRLDAPRANNPVAETTLALAAALARDEFAAGALEAEIICLPVLGFDDLERTEQYVVNEQFLTVPHEPLGVDLGFVRSPVDGMNGDVEITRAPMLGEHQELIDELASSPSQASVPGASDVVASATPDPATALDGIRVVDFSWVLAGPLGTRILANFGAEVIRVESATKPDSMRSQAGPDGAPDPDLGGLFNSVNTGKKSLGIDLATAQGLAVVKRLIAGADVVVNNFRPGAMERMGLGYEVLTELKPDIVLLNLPGAHRIGPWAVRPSMGNILMAASGFNMLTGFEGERPRGIGIAYPDFTGPHLLVSTVLAALRQRDRSGSGQQIHLTQLTGMVSLLGADWLSYKATGEEPQRRANRDPNLCPHGIFRAQGSEHSDDEWVALAVADDEQFVRLAELVGSPQLSQDSRFVTHDARKANEDELDEIIEAWTSPQDKWELADALQAADIAAAAVEHVADTYGRDPQLQEHYQVVHQPIRPDLDIPVDREPARWVGAEHTIRRAPGLGEHNEHVLCDVLGYSSDEYVELVLAGVLA